MKRHWVHDQLRERLLARAGCPDVPPAKALPNLDELRRTQWSDEFEREWRDAYAADLDPEFLELMHNRLIMGALRYGLLARPGKPAYDNVGSILRRLVAYDKDGNLEHMVDTANIALVEYVEGKHPQRNATPIMVPGWSRPPMINPADLANLRECLGFYRASGNVRYLVVVACCALAEWQFGRHPLRHFATGDGDIHTAHA